MAAGDEGCFYLGVYLQVGDVVYCSAGFGELSADIVFLWCVGLLVFVWHGGSAIVAMFVCGRELQLCWGDSECHAKHHLSLCRGFGEHFLECLVVVAIENRPRCYASRHLMRKNPVALSLIDPEANQLTLWREETHAIAIGKGCDRRDIKTVATNLLHLPHIFAYGLGGEERRLISTSAISKISGKAPVETLVDIRLEGIGTTSHRSTLI